MITIIGAMARNRVIGIENRLPWHLPEDLQHFKKTTLGHPMIMGRKTFESLPGVLPNRLHLVLTRSKDFVAPEGKAVQGVPDLMTAFHIARLASDETFVIGGANVYEQAMPFADRLIMTTIDQDYEGDAYFPMMNRDDFKIAAVEQLETASMGPVNVCTFMRRLDAY